jgi:hypothetical protein
LYQWDLLLVVLNNKWQCSSFETHIFLYFHLSSNCQQVFHQSPRKQANNASWSDMKWFNILNEWPTFISNLRRVKWSQKIVKYVKWDWIQHFTAIGQSISDKGHEQQDLNNFWWTAFRFCVNTRSGRGTAIWSDLFLVVRPTAAHVASFGAVWLQLLVLNE